MTYPTAHSTVTMKNGDQYHSTEAYRDVTYRLRLFRHTHMPLKVIVALEEREITVNREDVSIVEAAR